MKDYYPLRTAAKYQYAYESSEFGGTAKVTTVVLSVEKKGKTETADMRMTVELRGHETFTEFAVTKSAKAVVSCDGIVMGGRTEFIRPVRKGLKWEELPDRSEIAETGVKLSLANGMEFPDCIKVVTNTSGRHGASSVRYYANGVGYVYEEYNGDDLCAKVCLSSIEEAPLEELKRRRKKQEEEQEEPIPEAQEEKPAHKPAKKTVKNKKK